jgi:hypothetical protein
MKQSTVITKIVMIVLFFAVICYLGVYAVQSLSDPYTMIMAYRYTVDDGAETVGWLVREERVLPSSGNGIVDILVDEGEKVGAGQTAAVLYRDDTAMERKQEIRALEMELEQLEYSLQGSSAEDVGQLDEEIVQSITALRQTAASGDYSAVDGQALTLKSLIFHREYTYDGQDTEAGIQAMIDQVNSQIKALQSQSASDTSRIIVAQSGNFSGQVDGYEEVLTPAVLTDLTPTALAQLTGQSVQGESGAVGKLITSSRWYLATTLSQEEADRLQEGGSVIVAFSRDYSGDVEMRVDHLSQPENGQVAAVFSTDQHLADTTLLRKQTVDVVFQRYSGIRIPTKALRLRTQTSTDKETGEETQVQESGVYTLSGATAEFRPVEILYQGEDFYLVTPAPVSENDKRILRPGDEVIISAEELYDGKVVR